MYDEDLHRLAYKRVLAKKKFRRHLGTYLVMGTFFFILNMLTSPRDLWFYWPMLGWGLGLAMHYLNTYGFPGGDIDQWEEKEMRKEMERLERRRSGMPVPRRKEDTALELREMERAYQQQKSYRDDELV